MGKVIRLNEGDIQRIVKRVLNERDTSHTDPEQLPLCSEFKTFIEYNIGDLFMMDFDEKGVARLYCRRDKADNNYLGYDSLPPCVKHKDYCRLC